MDNLICDKCGTELIAGKNWYTNKDDHVFCDCSSYPKYYALLRMDSLPSPLYNDGDAEEAILARHECWHD